MARHQTPERDGVVAAILNDGVMGHGGGMAHDIVNRIVATHNAVVEFDRPCQIRPSDLIQGLQTAGFPNPNGWPDR